MDFEKNTAEAPLDLQLWVRSLFAEFPQMVCLCRNGEIAYVNPAGEQLLAGLIEGGGSGLVGRPLKEFLRQDDIPLLDHLLRDPAASSNGKLTFLRHDGSTIPSEVSLSRGDPLESGQLLLFARPIPGEKEAPFGGYAESYLEGILNAVADGIVTLRPTGEIKDVNTSICTIFGYDRDQLIGQPLQFLVPGLTSDFSEKLKALLRGETQSNGAGTGFWELDGRRESGTKFPLEIRISGLVQDDGAYGIGVIRDVGARRKIENELRRAASIIETSPDGIIVTDADFRIIDVNPAFSLMTGFEKNQVVGRRPGFINVLETEKRIEELEHALRDHGLWRGELWSTRHDGEKFAERISVTTITDENGKVTNHAILTADITQRKQDEERILYQAYYDQLTDLPNRTLFADRLEQALAATGRRGKKVGLMFIDLDGFKLINDTLGHELGDVLLRETAHRLNLCVRKADTIARMGGDEFTAVLPDIKDEYDLTTIAKRILTSLIKPFDLDGHESYVSASIGIAVAPDDGADSATLIKNADTAMYRAKEAGKATFQYFIPELNKEVEAQAALKNGLAAALERREFHLLYMPKLDVVTGRITGVEALMRWENPNLGLVSPARFIPVLEEMRVVGEIGEWVLEEACWQWRNWQAQGHDNLALSVNISARQLQMGGFDKALRRVHRETGVPLEKIELEVTEKTLLSDRGGLSEILSELREMEVSVSMDDFGTGYAPLVYLKQLPIDRIKLDRSFIKDLTSDPGVAQLVKTIIAMAHALNRKVVAVGVETEEQMEMLRSFRCNEVQGYLVSRPVPGDEIIAALDGKT